MNAVVKLEQGAVAVSDRDLKNVLRTSLYPGASDESIGLVLGYCKASGLDPMQKPVHIVPMWDRNSGSMRDVIMPGIGLYRTQASRSGQYAGMSEAEYGPDVTETLGEVQVTYPAWCKVSAMRRLPTGEIAVFHAKEFWKENYAVKGGKDKSIAPNAMWLKRPYGQIAKCAEAQALRKAFPEIGSQPTAEEMEGKAMGAEPELAHVVTSIPDDRAAELREQIAEAMDLPSLMALWKSMAQPERDAMMVDMGDARRRVQQAAIQAEQERPE